MNAKEMFKQLGYKLAPEGTYIENEVLPYRDYKKNISIEFYLRDKKFNKARGIIDSVNINCAELMAIIQQCKELGWIELEQKQETNLDHYKDDIAELFINDLAIVDDKAKRCCLTDCSLCCFDFKGRKGYECSNIKKEWLRKPYVKPVYKLTKFEYDLIQTYSDCHENCKFSKYKRLIKLKDKGYFKCADYNTKIKDILANCEVVKNAKG